MMAVRVVCPVNPVFLGQLDSRVQAVIEIRRCHVRARHHGLFGGRLSQLDDIMDHGSLFFVHHAFHGALFKAIGQFALEILLCILNRFGALKPRAHAAKQRANHGNGLERQRGYAKARQHAAQGGFIALADNQRRNNQGGHNRDQNRHHGGIGQLSETEVGEARADEHNPGRGVNHEPDHAADARHLYELVITASQGFKALALASIVLEQLEEKGEVVVVQRVVHNRDV